MKIYLSTICFIAIAPHSAVGELANNESRQRSEIQGSATANRFDAQDRQISMLAAQVDELTRQLSISGARRRGASTDMILDWGVRVNDPSFDNGRVISDAIARGNVSGPIFAPSGAIYHSTTINLGGQTGLNIIGGGVSHWLPEVSYKLGATGGIAATRFVYVGPAEKPAWVYQGVGLSLDGIVIQRGTYSANPKRDGSVGFAIERGPVGNPTGKMQWGQIAFFGWDTAIDNRAVGDGHCDNTAVDWVWFLHCLTCYRSNNQQAVNWDWQFFKANGMLENIFEFVRGGGHRIGTLSLDNKALIFKLIQSLPNSETYMIHNLRVDNNAKGWRLVEQVNPGRLNLFVRGEIGIQAEPGPNPISLKNYPPPSNQPQHIDVRMVRDWQVWPEDAKRSKQ